MIEIRCIDVSLEPQGETKLPLYLGAHVLPWTLPLEIKAARGYKSNIPVFLCKRFADTHRQLFLQQPSFSFSNTEMTVLANSRSKAE